MIVYGIIENTEDICYLLPLYLNRETAEKELARLNTDGSYIFQGRSRKIINRQRYGIEEIEVEEN